MNKKPYPILTIRPERSRKLICEQSDNKSSAILKTPLRFERLREVVNTN